MQTTTATPTTTMEITLKNVKTFRGNEGHGLNADVYVNGIKTCFVIDDANGGMFMYQPYNKEMFKKLEEYVKSLPERESLIQVSETEKESFKFQPDLDTLIDDAFNAHERVKTLKKFEKKMVNTIIVGNPTDLYSTGSYQIGEYRYKKPLSTIPKDVLQKNVDKIKADLRPGEEILNNNLKPLGIIF